MKKIDFNEYTIETDKLPKDSAGYKFIVMSDLHSNSYGIDLHYVNRIVRRVKPDAVLIAGDMFNGIVHDDPSDVLNYLAVLAGHFPVFFALGNHEYRMKLYEDTYGSRFYDIRDYLSEAGVVFLEDETVILDKDGARLALTGVEIDSAFYSKFRKTAMGSGLMEKHLGPADRNIYNILLAHNPEYFHRYAGWGADLTISGHNHGGMIRVPGIGGIFSPKLTLMPEYDWGMYEKDGSMMLVGKGMGAHSVKIRINNRPELIQLKILAKNGL